MTQLGNNEIISVLQEIAKEANLKVTVKESLKGAGIVGTTTFVGSILGGPVGMALGGLIGSIAAYANSEDFKSVPVVIAQMTPAERNQLVQMVRPIILSAGFGKASASTILLFILSRPAIKDAIINAMCKFFTDVMRMQIQS